MTKITKFDKSNCRALQDDVVKALAAVCEKYGVRVSAAGGSMDGIKFNMKFVANVTDEAAVEADAIASFNQHCHLFNLEPKHRNVVVKVGGDRLQLLGFEMSRVKYPFRMKNVVTGAVKLYTDAVVDRIRAAAAVQ